MVRRLDQPTSKESMTTDVLQRRTGRIKTGIKTGIRVVGPPLPDERYASVYRNRIERLIAPPPFQKSERSTHNAARPGRKCGVNFMPTNEVEHKEVISWTEKCGSSGNWRHR